MFGVTRSFKLVRESFSVLSKDKELLLYPVFSGIVSLLLFLSFIVPVYLIGIPDGLGLLAYVYLFSFYVASYFVVIFFNTGLIACANIRLNGGDPRFMDGIRVAGKNIKNIFVWAFVSATVGVILRAVSNKSGAIGKIIVGLMGMAWTLLTFFVVPVMVFEKVSVKGAIKRSGALFRNTWGENVTGQFSMNIIFAILGLLGLIPLFMTIFTGNGTVIIFFLALTILYWVTLGIISSSLNGIFTAALYNYAVTGNPPQGFSEEMIRGAWKPRNR